MQKLNIKRGHVELMHGDGAKASHQLIQSLFFKHYGNEVLKRGIDGPKLNLSSEDIMFTTDSYVVTPRFFPGGDIGKLAVYGTVNDLSVSGAKPLYLSLSFILEEGLPLRELDAIVESISMALNETETQIVTGDTKVVERGAADGIFINTTGIGMPFNLAKIHNQLQLGDVIIVSGPIGNHGIAVMSKRENLSFSTELFSDSQPLHRLCQSILTAVPEVSMMRDITRGGLGSILNEWAHSAQMGLLIEEDDIPKDEAVLGACELLGLDPLYVANEGILAVAVKEDYAKDLLTVMRSLPEARHANLIGKVVNECETYVEMKTSFGGHRLVEWLAGAQLPRIC